MENPTPGPQPGVPDPGSQAEALNRQLASALSELEALAHFISHDLRAPLRGIEGYSQALLEDYSGVLDEVGQAYLSYIHDSARSTSALIERLARYTRILQSPLEPAPVNLSTMAGEVLAGLQGRAPERQAALEIQPGMITDADAHMLRALLGEALENAWKFTGGRAEARIGFYSETVDDIPVYRVVDNGAGFDMAYSRKLFQPFQRLHGAHEFPGAGLGLAICRRIVERHNGRIWIEGAVDRGTTLFFTLG